MSILVYFILVSPILGSAKPGLTAMIWDSGADTNHYMIAVAKPRNVIPASRTIKKYESGKKDLRDKIRRFFDLRPSKLA